MPLSTGTRLGAYEVVALLGAGGMGEVYRARDTRLGRDVALKTLRAEVADDPSRRQRFEVEARALAALNHPNIVAVYDVGVKNGNLYIVSELVDGRTLRGAKLSLRQTIETALQIVEALAAAHAAGITHRDLKPENILLTRDGCVKILDFGLAKISRAHSTAADVTDTMTVGTEPGTVMGTAGYMSPEQVRGQELDHRSDIFSFGVILHELLADKHPFHGETPAETMTAILKQDPPKLPETVPSGLQDIVAHCLEKDSGHRFQSAKDLSFALAHCGAQTGSPPAPAPGLPGQRRPLMALAAFAFVVAGIAVGRLIWHSPPLRSWSGVLMGGPEVAMTPRISRDGHLLAFQGLVGDFQQIWVMKPESGNQVVLTHNTENGWIKALAWSSDGAKIYYDRWTDVPRGIYSVPVLGGAEQLILEDAAAPEALPDASLLVARYNAERQFQMYRFWPETGRLRAFPLEIGSVRAFPNGLEAVAAGTIIGPGREAGRHLYLADLESGSVRRLPSGLPDDSSLVQVAVTRDGASVLASSTAGNVTRITIIPKIGRSSARALLGLTSAVLSLDAGPDGSIYVDQVDRPRDLLRFPAEGGHVEKIATFPAAEGYDNFAVLVDGRAVVPQRAGGLVRLMVVEAGKDSVPLVNTTEETAAPVAAVGPGEVAFVIGPEPHRTIAVATVANGRIIRRIPLDKGAIRSIASTPDGKILYFSAGGIVWAIPSSGGEPRRIRAGDGIAVHPAGHTLLVEMLETPKIRFVRVPLNGGAEQEIPQTGHLRLAPFISANAIGKNGSVVTPLGTSTWHWLPGRIDLSTGIITQIPVDYIADYHFLAWTPDGQVMAVARRMRSTIWKFQQEDR